MADTDIAGWAVRLARMGYSIFPLHPGAKIPRTRWRLGNPDDRASCSIEKVTAHWRDRPSDNIGIACEESGLLVLDADDKDAYLYLDRLWLKYEGTHLAHWDAPIIETRRGWHVYLDQPGAVPLGNTASKLGPGIDTRGVGGMVVGPGSVVKDHHYAVVHGDLEHVPPCPPWLILLLAPRLVLNPPTADSKWWRVPNPRKAERELAKGCEEIEQAPDGDQNNTISYWAWRLFHFCPPLDIEQVREELEAAAERGNHPVHRAKPTIRSGLTHTWSPDKCPFKH